MRERDIKAKGKKAYSFKGFLFLKQRLRLCLVLDAARHHRHCFNPRTVSSSLSGLFIRFCSSIHRQTCLPVTCFSRNLLGWSPSLNHPSLLVFLSLLLFNLWIYFCLYNYNYFDLIFMFYFCRVFSLQ